MASFNFVVDDAHVTLRLEAIGPDCREALRSVLGPAAAAIDDEARANAIGHFHSIGAKPGLYLAGFQHGSFEKGSRIGAYVRNGNQLAHLMEKGFTISDIDILPKTAEMMVFEGDAGKVFARHVHRHETKVQPYPALTPAFEAARDRLQADMTDAVKSAAAGA